MKSLLRALAVALCLIGFTYGGVRLGRKLSNPTIASRLAEFGAAADARWKPFFNNAGVAYPADRYTFAVFKDTKTMTVYAGEATGPLKFIRTLPILAASGGAGPKLREGDNQVPEGVYAIESLNPKSLYHVALRVNYPNAEDRAFAKAEGRMHPGGDIMIHGKACSIGCLAMGDAGAEDLFTLAARSGETAITLLLCPTDFPKNKSFSSPANVPAWLAPRYDRLRRELAALPPR